IKRVKDGALQAKKRAFPVVMRQDFADVTWPHMVWSGSGMQQGRLIPDMNQDGKAYCVLCKGDEETKITGPLSTKEDVTAHQNCLLYASGICCSNTPQFDDLFGFSVQDVKTEVNRGRKLVCSQCKRRGATAGCELKRCKKSFHYPCAIEEGAKVFEDKKTENYGLYCFNHSAEENRNSVNGSKANSCRRSSEGSQSKRKTNGESSRSKLSSSSSSDSSYTTTDSLKRQLNFTEHHTTTHQNLRTAPHQATPRTEEESTPTKKNKKWHKITSDEDTSDLAVGGLIPPLDSDSEEIGGVQTQNKSPEPQINSEVLDVPSEFQLVNQVEVECSDVNSLYSNSDSDSLLDPVPERHTVEIQTIKRELEDLSCEQNPICSCEQDTGEPSAPDNNIELVSFPSHPETQTPSTCSSFTVALCQPFSVNYLSVPSPSHAPASNTPPSPPRALDPDPPQAQSPSSAPAPSVNSASFWRNCNAASCTQTIFSELIEDMNEISTRIRSDKASQDDYDRALSVMMASGRLAEFVSRQQEELQRKQVELQRKAAAMKDIVSALRK
ncbi:uncharacterized protein DDB_G0284459, partial [Austrofundulus limnaeus]|uniref:Uncharacterized protein DDB_G0284459 n=1 Tax=Austrofundulus limnaeus TaxID=52670 RepID=A0A2I4DAS4_AUSLI